MHRLAAAPGEYFGLEGAFEYLMSSKSYIGMFFAAAPVVVVNVKVQTFFTRESVVMQYSSFCNIQ